MDSVLGYGSIGSSPTPYRTGKKCFPKGLNARHTAFHISPLLSVPLPCLPLTSLYNNENHKPIDPRNNEPRAGQIKSHTKAHHNQILSK